MHFPIERSLWAHGSDGQLLRCSHGRRLYRPPGEPGEHFSHTSTANAGLNLLSNCYLRVALP